MTGHVRRSGTTVVDADGRRALWRGVGLGTWLLPEGYMWRFPPPSGAGVPAASPRQIEALVHDLVGPERAAAFWREFHSVFVTEADVARIAAEGFDHVRLPINARVVMDEDGTLLEDGLALVDACVDWCRTHGLHVVLDLHGAPGGQTGTNIDDSPRGLPDLFSERRYQDLTVHLWTELARRYAHDTTVAAYDLLNEPLPDEHARVHSEDLVRLYREITAAIRAVDSDTLLMYEGTHWASDVSIFTQVWDERSVIQFHRYWAAPDRPGIERYLEVRDRLGLPLYMGEGGENAPSWLATAFALYEDLGIGWNFWTWKKVDNPHSPAVVVPPAGWADVQAYVAGTGPRPDAETAWETLVALLDAMRLERCEWHPEVVASLLRRAPLELPPTAFGFHGPGASWSTADPAQARPLPWFRADEPVTVEHVDGEDGADPFAADPRVRARAGRFVVELPAGDWVAYDVELPAGTAAGPTGGAASGEVPFGGPGAAWQVRLLADDDAQPDLDVWLDGVPVDGAWSGRTWTGTLPTGTSPGAAARLRVGPRVDRLRLAGVRVG